MKRELLNRLAISAALLLAVWASLANTVHDPLTVSITVGSLIMLVYYLMCAIYFIPYVHNYLKPRYRIIPVLEPIYAENAQAEEANKHLGATAGLNHMSRYKGNLSKLNARKMEAIKAAGLSNDQLNAARRVKRGDSNTTSAIGGTNTGTSGGNHYHRSVMKMMSGGEQQQQQQPAPGGAGSMPRLRRSESWMEASIMGASRGAAEASNSFIEEQDRTWSGQFFFQPWVLAIRYRRLIDAVFLVSLQ